jgi:hypothetical protein
MVLSAVAAGLLAPSEWVAFADIHQGVAAWVQAIGSIAAVVGVGWVVHLGFTEARAQEERERTAHEADRRTELRSRREAALALAESFVAQGWDTERELRKPKSDAHAFWERGRASWRSFQSSLVAFPSESLVDGPTIGAFVETVGLVEFVIQLLDAMGGQIREKNATAKARQIAARTADELAAAMLMAEVRVALLRDRLDA